MIEEKHINPYTVIKANKNVIEKMETILNYPIKDNEINSSNKENNIVNGHHGNKSRKYGVDIFSPIISKYIKVIRPKESQTYTISNLRMKI